LHSRNVYTRKKSASGRGISAKYLFSRTSQKSSIKSSTLSFTTGLDVWAGPMVWAMYYRLWTTFGLVNLTPDS